MVRRFADQPACRSPTAKAMGHPTPQLMADGALGPALHYADDVPEPRRTGATMPRVTRRHLSPRRSGSLASDASSGLVSSWFVAVGASCGRDAEADTE